jgi:hypothetical protein
MTILNRRLLAEGNLDSLPAAPRSVNPAHCLMCHGHADLIGLFVATPEMSRLMKTPDGKTGWVAYGLCMSCEKTFDLADVEYRLFTSLDLPADLLKRISDVVKDKSEGGTNGN